MNLLKFSILFVGAELLQSKGGELKSQVFVILQFSIQKKEPKIIFVGGGVAFQMDGRNKILGLMKGYLVDNINHTWTRGGQTPPPSVRTSHRIWGSVRRAKTFCVKNALISKNGGQKLLRTENFEKNFRLRRLPAPQALCSFNKIQ